MNFFFKNTFPLATFIFFSTNFCLCQSFRLNLTNPDSAISVAEVLGNAESEQWKHLIDSGDIAVSRDDYDRSLDTIIKLKINY